jgi:hypothetical protein
MKRILFRENAQSFIATAGYSVLSYKDGQMVVSDSTSGEKSVSSSGEKFTAAVKVYAGQLAYLKEDGLVASPQSISLEDDDNKADNIIGVILNDAEADELVYILTKGIWNGFTNEDNLDITPRSILYIDTEGNLTTVITPYLFGKVLAKEDNRIIIMVDISFIISTLDNYGIFPAFSKLVTSWDGDNDALTIKWESKDSISEFTLVSYISKSLGSTASIVEESIKYVDASLLSSNQVDFSSLEAYSSINPGSIVLCKIKSGDSKSVDFKFQLTGKSDVSVVSYTDEALQRDDLEGTGIFKDGGISGVNIDINFLSNNLWSFGTKNMIPLRKLFSLDFVGKDDLGKFIVISSGIGLDYDTKIYEDFSWKIIEEDAGGNSLYSASTVEKFVNTGYQVITSKIFEVIEKGDVEITGVETTIEIGLFDKLQSILSASFEYLSGKKLKVVFYIDGTLFDTQLATEEENNVEYTATSNLLSIKDRDKVSARLTIMADGKETEITNDVVDLLVSTKASESGYIAFVSFLYSPDIKISVGIILNGVAQIDTVNAEQTL